MNDPRKVVEPSGARSVEPTGAKKRDYWWTVLFTDPIAIPLARFLARKRWLTPDQVTWIALVLGLMSGVVFALAGYLAFYPEDRMWLFAGGIVFYLAFIVDCVDGKLARALGVTSARGAALDALADGGRRASASLGLFVYLWHNPLHSDLRLAVGAEEFVDALAALTRSEELLVMALYIVLAYYFLEISGAAKAEPKTRIGGRWSQALAKRRLLPNPGMPDVQAIVFILGPITGLVVPALWVGIAMVAVAILMTVRRRLHPTAEESG